MLTRHRYCQYYLTPRASICQITVNINNKTLHNKRLLCLFNQSDSLSAPVCPVYGPRTGEYWLLGVVWRLNLETGLYRSVPVASSIQHGGCMVNPRIRFSSNQS